MEVDLDAIERAARERITCHKESILDPATVLALVARARRAEELERVNARLRDHVAIWVDHGDDCPAYAGRGECDCELDASRETLAEDTNP